MWKIFGGSLIMLVKQRAQVEDDEITGQLCQSILFGDAFPFSANANYWWREGMAILHKILRWLEVCGAYFLTNTVFSLRNDGSFEGSKHRVPTLLPFNKNSYGKCTLWDGTTKRHTL